MDILKIKWLKGENILKKIFITVIAGIITIIFLLGFIDRNETEQVKSNADIVYSVNNIPKDLKSVGSLNKREQDIICAVSRGLVQVDIDGNILPSLAESVDIKDSGIEYDFKIRDDVYWSDGKKITPEDIVMFFREVITEEDEENIQALLNVFGVQNYLDSNSSFSETVGISFNDTNIIMRLNSKNDNFLKELSKPQYRLRKNILFWSDISGKYGEIPYSGDYKIQSIDEEQILLTRNEKSDGELAKTIHIMKDAGEDLALAAFEVGNRDIVINPPRSQLSRLKSDNKLVTLPSNRAMYLVFNPINEQMNISNKKEIYRLINKAMSEYQQANSTSVELAEGCYFRGASDDLSKLQSRKVMVNTIDEAVELEDIVLIAEEGLNNKEIINYLISWFSKNTDVELIGSLIDSSQMKDIKDKSYYDVALINLDATFTKEQDFLEQLSFYIPDELLSRINGLKSEEEKITAFLEIEDALFNSYRVLPLLFYNENIAINNGVENISLDGNGNLNFNIIKK